MLLYDCKLLESVEDIYLNLPVYYSLNLRDLIDFAKANKWLSLSDDIISSIQWNSSLSWEEEKDVLDYIKLPTGFKLDTYCEYCEKHSVFEFLSKNWKLLKVESNKYMPHSDYFVLLFQCTRCNEHELMFIFEEFKVAMKVNEKSVNIQMIKKIGQYPSYADLVQNEIWKYRKLLWIEYSSLSTAIWLHSHWVWIWSFVYLRRIFEDLIKQAYKNYIANWWELDETQFSALHMPEKILELKNELPPFLSAHKQIYSILSKGVHTLTDKECMENFDTMLTSITLILDEKIAKLESDKKVKEISAKLSQVHKEVKGK